MDRGPLSILTLVGAVLLSSSPLAPATSPDVAWRIPGPFILEASAGTEGRVIFDHGTHLAFLGARCTACHPGMFSILGRNKPVSHDEMNAGRSCGTCHDGKRAPSTASDEACTTCHTGWGAREASTLLDVTLTGAGSPGVVVFRHASHVDAGTSCSACHPDPFALELAGTLVAASPDGGHESCARCHDGKTAFDLDEADCGTCHREVSP